MNKFTNLINGDKTSMILRTMGGGRGVILRKQPSAQFTC